MPSRRVVLGVILVLLVLVWLFSVITGYYIVHKPFTVENALALMNTLGDVMVAGALFAIASALGRRVTRALTFGSPLEALVLQTGLGLGLISFAVFALGLGGLLNPLLFWIVLFVAAFLLRGDLCMAWRDLRLVKLPIVSRFERMLAWFCGIALGLAFLLALTPPIAWDAQTYHLVIGKIAIERGRIAAPPDILYLNFPSLVEMLFLAAMLLKSDIAAQLLHFGFFLLMLGAVFAFAQRYWNVRVAWLACALLVAVPSLLAIATWAYVDVALGFYTFVALFVLFIARAQDDWRWFAFSGAFVGMALGIKYTAVIVPIALGILILLSASSRRWRFGVTHFATVIAFAAPWYLRNLIFTRNPVYPFILGGPNWDSFRAEWFSRLGTGLINAPLQLVTAPWDAAIFGTEGGLGYEATIGPLLLGLLPLIFLVLRQPPRAPRNPILRDLVIFSLMLYGFWLFGIAESKLLLQTRLLFPAFPGLAIMAAIAFDHVGDLDLPQFSLQRFIRLVVGLILGLTGLGYALGFAADNPLAYLVGAESRASYLTRHLGGYASAIQFVNRQLPADARVLFLWEPRSYYAQRSVQPDAILDLFAHARTQARDADALAALWRQQGYTHILVSRGGLDYMAQSGYDSLTDEDAQVLQQFAQGYLRQIYGQVPLEFITQNGKRGLLGAAEDTYAIYEIKR